MFDRLLGRLLAWSERLLRIGWIAEAKAVVDADDEAGGGLLAAALAYRAIFGLLSGLILVAGLIGWLIDDPATRAAAIDAVAGLVPGLEPIVEAGLESLVEERGTLSIVGLVGAAFGASIFYDALDQSMNRLMPGGGQRNPIVRRLLGMAGIVMLALVGVAALGVGIALGPVSTTAPSWIQVLAAVLRPVLIIVLLALSLGAIYRWVPIQRPALVDIRVPAVVTAAAIWLASEVFAIVAPLLVRQLAIFGVFVSLLALLIWLSWVTQLLVLGGSWSRVRRDARAVEATLEGAAPADAAPGAGRGGQAA
ncbi:MAG TPA: YihY/virulence factor BrkB family protein [Candidatus Limnocylindrales bacterium]|jgi:membrane protein